MSEGWRPVKVKIVVNELCRGSVEVDGRNIRNVRAVEFKSRVGEVTTVTLELVGAEVELEAEVPHVSADITSTSSPRLSREFAAVKVQPASH